VTATNERTGQVKVARPGSTGLFCIDGNFTDYLALDEDNGLMPWPWVAQGDNVSIKAADASGVENSTTITIDLSKERQSIGILDLSTG
jgi:hypothetical protein